MATLSENKIKMIDMILDGKSVAEIARNLNKSRQCIYNWLKSEDVIEEIENRNKSRYELNEELINYIKNMKKLSNSEDESVALKANMFLLNLAFNN